MALNFIQQNSRKPMESNYRFTVFTSCFNSEPFINRLYESLKAQSFLNFEWLIVDDFSEDLTREILKNIEKDAPFDVRIFHNDSNQMIASCCNFAVNNARGQFFLFLDHDDELVPNALERFDQIWQNIEQAKKAKLVGMMSNCQDQFGNYVHDELPELPLITDFYSLYYNLGIRGEKFFCYLTSILKEYNFSTVDRYVPENVMLFNISDDYDTYFFNENLRIYHINQENHESLADKLAGGWKIAFPKGMRHAKLEDLNRRSRKMISHPILFLKTIINFIRFSLHSDILLKNTFQDLHNPILKIFAFFLSPVSVILYFRDKAKQ
jgi:glycosyltransferase involved in cell wall biosynthesis